MILFKSLSYQNFLSTGNTPTTIDLNRSSATLVVGANGAGKSTMLDALSFVLFGKAHRNINKPQLVNSVNQKKLLVTCEFSIGKTEYKIVRGIKPVVFEIYRNGKMINQESHSRDYQKVLEQNILHLNHKSFHQVVVLGSGNFIPFMQLPANLRRGVIEDLLDINIFTRMNLLVKERYTSLKNEISQTDHQLDLLKSQIQLKEKHIKKLQEIDLQQATKNQKKIDDLKEEIELLRVRNTDLRKEYDSKNPDLEAQHKKDSDKRKELEGYRGQIRNNINSLVKEVKFYDNNDTCPTCHQDIGDDIKKERTEESKTKAKELNAGLEQIEDSISKCGQSIDKMVQGLKEMSDIMSQVMVNDSMIRNIEKGIDETSAEKTDTSHIEEERAELDEKKFDLDRMLNHKSEQLEKRSYYDAVGELLKDSGIKTKIIREYLPVMNNLINKYLNILDFFVLFNIDESFNETIKSRHRDDFTYPSFSEGEKQRIDLALLFTWRQVARMKNSANTNLLILDETFDSSLDADGVDNLIKILYTLREDSNVFIISHKQDLLDGKFPARMEFVKTNNFSKIKM
jgi:DNA repair exonuclease SbcCD ATPase subunit